MIEDMETQVLHVTESDLVRDVRSVLRRVETGAEIVIERDAHPIAVLRSAAPPRRKLSECIALLSDDSSATIDPDWASDVEAAVASHREALEPPVWG